MLVINIILILFMNIVKTLVKDTENLEKNPEEGIRYVRIEANNENRDAMGYYGDMLFFSKGLISPKNYIHS